jgi:hypothetical protein
VLDNSVLHSSSRFWRHFLNHDSPLRQRWDFLVVFLIFLEVLFVPYLAAFRPYSYTVLDDLSAYYPYIYTFVYLVDIMYFLDVVSQFFTVKYVHGRPLVDKDAIKK